MYQRISRRGEIQPNRLAHISEQIVRLLTSHKYKLNCAIFEHSRAG